MAGRGRIENLKMWPKGVSGNPSGRPKKRPISDEYERIADCPLPDEIRKKLRMKKGTTFREALAVRTFYAAMRGQSAAAREIREAIEGKATQRLELTGAEGKPLTPGAPARPLKTYTQEQLDAIVRLSLKIDKEAEAGVPPSPPPTGK